jgi:membrane dipeptidase
LSERPAIFSHSGAHNVCPHIRNIHDDQIRACADRGGVVGIVGIGAFLGDPEAGTESMFRHLDYIAELVGAQHVGIGTDFVPWMPFKDYEHEFEARAGIVPGDETWPGSDDANAWPDPTGTQIPLDESRCVQPEQLSELVAMMLGHGYAIDDIKGILGANFRRVYASLP